MAMINVGLNKENEIFIAATTVFLMYGYHGSTLCQIADLAGVNKTSIHYYFRSKKLLYDKVVFYVIENILSTENDLIKNNKSLEKQRWFLYTELYNNRILFEESLKKMYSNNWVKKIDSISKWLKNNHFN